MKIRVGRVLGGWSKLGAVAGDTDREGDVNVRIQAAVKAGVASDGVYVR